MDHVIPWDVIVVGSGATGGWAAHELGRHGLRVLVLEAGRDRGDAPRPGRQRWYQAKRYADRGLRWRRNQMRHHGYWEIDPSLWVIDRFHPFEAAPGTDFEWIRTRAVNGRLLTWGGIGVRMSDHEFFAPRADGFGEPWPFGYSELAAHYDRIDEFLPVYGEHDGLAQLPDGHYVGAPQLTDAEHHVRAAAREQLGLDVIAGRGVLIRPHARPRGEAPPPSPVRAAVARFGVTLRTNAIVSEVLTDAAGRARGVTVVDRLTRRKEQLAGRAIVLAASTLESTRILLNSRSPQHPEGLGNSSGALGHYLMDHVGVHLGGYTPGRRDAAWDDGYGGPKNLMVPRHHNLANRPGGAFLRGWGSFGTVGRLPPGADCRPDEVRFSVVSYGEMLPQFGNHVSLHPTRRDAWGIPILRVEAAFSDNELALREAMVAGLRELIDAAGGRPDAHPDHLAPGGFVHEVGTARMGSDPATSVLNEYAQSWDVPNLFVVDGAAWPTNAWQNPTFTMMAVAGRACARLAGELAAGRM